MLGQSSFYARGDENNQDVSGPLPGFFFLNLDARWRPSAHWEFALTVENAFDRAYSTFGLLSKNLFTGPSRSFDYTGTLWHSEQFRSVAAPRGFWLTASYSLTSHATD